MIQINHILDSSLTIVMQNYLPELSPVSEPLKFSQQLLSLTDFA